MNGTRVAVVGAGVCGCAVAAVLAHGARARGKKLDVCVYGDDRPGFPSPVLLTRECRTRLAALGCAVPPGGRSLPEVEVLAGTRGERFPSGTGGLWVVEREALVDALAAAAAREGARFLGRRVQAIARDDRPEGPLVVRAHGSIERFNSVVLATGAADGPPPLLGSRGPPTLRAIEAQLAPYAFAGPETAKLFLAPVPGVAGLYLVPNGRAVHALAFGESPSEEDLCQALMVASRDGHVPMGFAVARVRSSRVSNGVGPVLVAPGVLAVGPAALGHPLQLGLTAALASCSRVAAAMLDSNGDPAELRHLVPAGCAELVENARLGAKAFAWLVRARAAGPAAIARARGHDGPGCWGGVLGLPSPTPRSLLRSARRAGLAQGLRSLFLVPTEPALTLPPPEPRLVYVVEDDDDAREALTEFLRAKGAEVIGFSDELSLFAAVALRRPAAIVLDVVLRRVDGLRLCEGLKHHPLSRDIRVLVTSGLDLPHVRQRALAAGAAAFLPKPLDPVLLWASLATGIEDAGAPLNQTGARSPRREGQGPTDLEDQRPA